MKPKKELMDKYSKKVIFLSQLPFGSRWRKGINKEDIELMKRYQGRIKIWYLTLIIPFVLIFIYLFTDTVVDFIYWRNRVGVP